MERVIQHEQLTPKRTRTQRSGTRLDGYRVDFAVWAHTLCRSLTERGNQVREQESGDGDEYEYE